MKPAILIYNADAGSSQGAAPQDLLAGLRHSGYDVHHRPTENESDLDRVLADAYGTVFVAGGDGTVRGTALRLLGKPGVQLAIIPMGTSNNVGHTLNLSDKPAELVQHYAEAQIIPYDVGQIDAPWGQDLFIEACGCGIFADILAAYDPGPRKSPLRAAQAIVTTMPGYPGLPLALTIDGVPQTENQLTLLEVMNIRATSNSMKLGTNADPSDGKLDVVTVDAERRDGLLAYLSALARDEFGALSSVATVPAQTIDIPYVGQAFHIDGEVRPALEGEAKEKASGIVHIRVLLAALSVLVPSVSLNR